MGESEKSRLLWPSPPRSMKKTPLGLDIHKAYDYECNEWVVDEILELRSRNFELEYLISWKGYPREYASWEPVKHAKNCPQKVKEFWIRQLKSEILYEGYEKKIEKIEFFLCKIKNRK